jgi:hypothetical protein
MIERLNILELFGADNNKYHSCIITCYSFDFLFFEQRVLPMLRRAGMININVFVDAKMYQQQLTNLDGNYIIKQSYSITPIQLNGAFHPKILMGFGKTNGFLAVGSGNLTNSGLSSNDEVWGAFHTYNTESNALPLFKSAFDYLKKLKPFCYGSNHQKWDWIEQNPPWLSDLTSSTSTISTNNNEKLVLLDSFGDKSIYEQLLEKLPKAKLENLTIISPYFNKNGDLITRLIKDLKPEKTHIVIDDRYGTVPYLFSVESNVQFHQWESLKTKDSNKSSMLHAKIFQFRYKNETCLLTGSANATTEAFGTSTANSKNAEMSLFISTNESKSWLNELGIDIPEKGTYNIKNYNKEQYQTITSIDLDTFDYKINYAELDVLQLFLYVTNITKIPKESKVAIENTNDTIAYYPIIINEINPIAIEVSELSAKYGFKVYLVDPLNNRISNFEKIHNNQLLQRTNPDAKASKFLDIINGTELKDDDLVTLLEFANFEDPAKSRNASSKNVAVGTKSSEEDDKEYGTEEEEEFNKNQDVIEHRYNNATSHLSFLEEYLNHMTFRDANEDFSDSSERSAIEEDGGVRGPNSVVNEQRILSFHDGQRLKNKLHKKFEEINTVLLTKHSDVYSDLVDNKKSNKKASIENVQSLLVGTHLIFMKMNDTYYEERFKIIVKYDTIENLTSFEKVRGINLQRFGEYKNLMAKEVAYSADANAISEIQKIIEKHKGIELVAADETPSISIAHNFFQDGPVLSMSTPNLCSKKGFLINSVSKFLLILANGTMEYNYQELIKFKGFKKRLFYRILLLFLSLNWKNKESKILELFLLNIIHQLLPENTTIEAVFTELETFENKLKTPDNTIKKNEEMLLSVLHSYFKWFDIYNNNKNELIKELDKSSVGRIIFKSNCGFATISGNFEGTLNFHTPLGIFNKISEEYEIKNVKSGSKVIVY